MPFNFHQRDAWPPLAWVAWGRLGESTVNVHHGSGVHLGSGWFGEIVWDGSFQDAAFDQTDLVFGSGARQRDQEITFVSASHTVDRLIWCLDGRNYWISNSLPALLTISGTQIDLLYPHYPRDFTSMIRGLSEYQRELARASRPVRLLYHDNLKLTADGLEVIEKPVIERDLSTFEHYRDFLRQSLVACADNLSDPGRDFSFRWLGTLSTGFDSPTVCALAKDAGLNDAITITSAREGKDDSGTEIGRRLGIQTEQIERDAWRSVHQAEIPFLSADAKGEDLYFRGAESLLRGRVLLTGYAAGAWARREKPLTQLNRADQSGLSLSEYRLWAGFINLPVPTMGLRSGGGIYRVNLSDEMASWYSGRAYDKPFCRRVLVEAGVEDQMFAVEKKAASVLMFDRRSFLSPESLADFRRYLKRIGFAGRCAHQLHLGARAAAAMLAVKSASLLPGEFAARIQRSVRLNETAYRDPRYDYLYGWATEHAIERYST